MQKGLFQHLYWCIQSSLALGSFSQPEHFLQLSKPLAKAKDGFFDRITIRITISSVKPHLLQEVIKEWCDKLSEYTTQGFTGES